MYSNVYFIGIGGIGMSALARHFAHEGYSVAGYDRTASDITRGLEESGAAVSYADDAATIPATHRDADTTLVVLTPAIPQESAIWAFFRAGGFRIVKRSEALGELTRPKRTFCVAGTHGKTTTSTLAAHILRHSGGCSAFLGGISVNYATNYWADATSDRVVTEADEFDRSFLHLEPEGAIITSMDADHLDIYGTHAEVIKAFLQFAGLVREGGTLVIRKGLPIGREDVRPGVKIVTYSLLDPDADCHAENLRVESGRYVFDFVCGDTRIADIRLGLPGRHNVENCVAAIALALAAGANTADIAEACSTFRGNKRRFELKVESDSAVVIDDYAHHPKEIEATLRSVRALYPGRRLTVAFQPHLYSRTRDLADEFAEALSMADRTWLLDIYPARELPIEGITTPWLMSKMRPGVGRMSTKESLAADIATEPTDIVVVMGAGNIDALVDGVAAAVRSAHGL